MRSIRKAHVRALPSAVVSELAATWTVRLARSRPALAGAGTKEDAMAEPADPGPPAPAAGTRRAFPGRPGRAGDDKLAKEGGCHDRTGRAGDL